MAKIESRIHRLIRQQSIIFLAIAFVTCCLASVLGSEIKTAHPAVAEILTLIGGTGLGTCLGLVFGGLSNISTTQKITELLEESLDTSLNATEAELMPFRVLMYGYIKSKIGDKPVWRYRPVDFSRIHVPKKLVSTFEVPGPNSGKHKYHVEGHVITPRLLFVQRADSGNEPPIIHVYPNATETFRSYYAGMAFLKSWDGDEICTPVLISKEKLNLDITYKEGTLPESSFAMLDDIWAKEQNRLGFNITKNDFF